MKENCGCSPKKPITNSDGYLLVKATGSSANPCGLPNDDISSEANCPKQEPTFDAIRSQFLVPVNNQTTSIIVCNASVYSVGQWIQFLNPSVILEITAINGNTIALRNSCPNGVPIDSNPNPGTTVSNGSLFSVAAKPPCLNEAQQAEQLQGVLNAMAELQAESLLESSSTGIVQPVGRVESDPSNPSSRKAIRRIFGVLFNAGRPYLSRLGLPVNISDRALYRNLVINKSTNEVRAIKSNSEDDGLQSGKQYMSAFQNNSEYNIGPAYGVNRFDHVIASLGNITGISQGPPDRIIVQPTHNVPEFNLAGLQQVIDTKRNLDHYYADIFIVASAVSNYQTHVYINGEMVGFMGDIQDGDEDGHGCSIFFPVRISNSNQKINISFVNRIAPFALSYKITLKGISH